MSQEIKLELIGEQKMSCGGCEKTIEFALSQKEEVRSVKADRKKQIIVIELKDNTDLQAIQKELTWIGYETQVLL